MAYDRNSAHGTMKMAYDPTKALLEICSRVGYVYAKTGYSSDIVRVHTYSSETGNWSDHGDRYWSKLNVTMFKYGIYWSNAIHWVESPNDYKLDLENLSITSVQAPVTVVDGMMCSERKLFESRGCLILACVYAHYTHCFEQLYVYEMSNEHSEWSTKYVVTLDESVRSFSNIWRRPDKWVSTSVWSVVLGERDEDSFLVIELYGKVMQYHVISKAIRELRNFKSIDQCPRSFQFIASFAGV
ncbi:F-box protein At5g07610-like [Rutidosis leptorrhynchoides]|uniref:F-box protein At5g07610-like n=1 Tax=Rutidosis leptorrhynchoides TaxID=125765 RepID=UPI003A99275C